MKNYHDEWYEIYTDLVMGGMDPDEAEVQATDLLEGDDEEILLPNSWVEAD